MRRSWDALALAAAALCATPSYAADHKDGPAVTANPAADITDVYAWMTPDKTKVNLVMDVSPMATATSKFSDQTQYVLHTSAAPGFGMAAAATTDVLCQFDAAQTISCWVGGAEYVTGDASATTGLTSADGKVKIFAGLRDDPFFFNITGFRNTVTAVEAAAPGLAFDGNGCPMLNMGQSMMLTNTLASGAGGGAAMDDFGGQNVLSIVIQLDVSLVASTTNPILAVWGSTNLRTS